MNTERQPREVTVTVKQGPSSSSAFELVERAAKLLSLVAIPVVLGISGHLIQLRLQSGTLARDYVQVGLDILRSSETDIGLKKWARTLVDMHAPGGLTFASVERDLALRIDNSTISLPFERQVAEVDAIRSQVASLQSSVDTQLATLRPDQLEHARIALSRTTFIGEEDTWPDSANDDDKRRWLRQMSRGGDELIDVLELSVFLRLLERID